MHKSQSLFYLTTALLVSGVTITHLQEHNTIVTTASGNRYTALLSAAIVEALELIIITMHGHMNINFFYYMLYVINLW
jgi:Ca2+/H+ antiporter